MKVITQHFFGTTREWEETNPILYKAVWGFEKTVDGKIIAYLGDGKTHWSELKPFNEIESIIGLSEELKAIHEKMTKVAIIDTPNFFRLYVNDDGELILQTNSGAENPLRYDEETGELFYKLGEKEFNVGNIRCKACKNTSETIG